MKLVIIILSILLSPATARPSFTRRRSFSFGAHLISRGGGRRATSVATDAEYTAVGVIPSQVLDTNAILSLPSPLQQAFQSQEDASLILLKRANPTSISTLPKNSEMLETLSMTCHVLVVFLSNNEIELQPDIIKSILEGARRRRKLAGHDKLKLIVVLSGTSSETDETRVALALKELEDIAPQDFDAFELTTTPQLSKIWDEMVSHNNDGENTAVELIDEQGLAKLISTIYESLSHKKCEITLNTWRESKKHHSSESALVADQVMTHAQPLIETLEAKLQDVWLNQDSTPPILEFGIEANGILQQASSTINDYKPPLSNETRLEILLTLATRLRAMYDLHLQALREHYGRRYEAVLDNPEKSKEEWTLEAQQVTEAFRAAGLNAIPKLCQEGQELVDADFSYVVALQGLIADMMEATSERDDEGVEEYESEEEGAPSRVAKWYEKLAARAVVLGINYLQGYMAWQAVQRAALERDKNVPKFPLF